MAINNPYIPGDPYSYDLKWIVQKLKTIPTDERINELIIEALENGNILKELLSQMTVFDVKTYGAAGDQLTDDTEAIRNAYAAAAENGGAIYFPAGEYLTTETLEFDKVVDVLMEGEIYSPEAETVVRVGSETEQLSSMRQVWRVKGLNALNTGSVGIEFVNLNNCLIRIDNANYFEKGIILVGDGRGFQNNIISLGGFTNTVYGVTMTNRNSGWCNDNLLIGGRFTKFSSVTVPSTAFRLTSEATYYNNNNVFIKPNCEKCDVGFAFEYARFNKVYNARTELTAAVATYANDSQNNVIDIGYGDFTENSAVNKTYPSRIKDRIDYNTVKTFALDDFAGNSASNATRGSIKDIYNYDGTLAPYPYNLSLPFSTATNDQITLGNGAYPVARFAVRPRQGRYLDMFVKVGPSASYRAIFAFFDANGNNITTAPEMFDTQTFSAFTASSTTVWRTGSNATGSAHFAIGIPENAAHVYAGVQTMSASDLSGYVITTDADMINVGHNVILPSIPTVNGVRVGQACTGTDGKLWIWNGSAWVQNA